MARKRSPEVQRAFDEVERGKDPKPKPAKKAHKVKGEHKFPDNAPRTKGPETREQSKNRLKNLKGGHPLRKGEAWPGEKFDKDGNPITIHEIEIVPADKKGRPKGLLVPVDVSERKLGHFSVDKDQTGRKKQKKAPLTDEEKAMKKYKADQRALAKKRKA